ncbi:MAG: DUF3047 domain-containing protein [Burkholderiales bacterium]|jgi:hypothetical protein|nr:DUF3047 domain-containing protein [Burkholderiales bacterium]
MLPSKLRLFAFASLALAASYACADPLQAFAGTGSAPAAPWKVVGLPKQTKPFTRFSVVELEGHRALRVEATMSYGNLVHPLELAQPPHHLVWDWRVDEPLLNADIRTRDGEDIAMKVCTLWDMPIDRVPFFDRQVLRMARSRTNEAVPAATVCYVWDMHVPVGTELASPFTSRIRYIVLRGGGDALHHWEHERRDIAADFIKLFGAEAQELPPLIGIAVGADADNTHSHSLAHAADVQLEP